MITMMQHSLENDIFLTNCLRFSHLVRMNGTKATKVKRVGERPGSRPSDDVLVPWTSTLHRGVLVIVTWWESRRSVKGRYELIMFGPRSRAQVPDLASTPNAVMKRYFFVTIRTYILTQKILQVHIRVILIIIAAAFFMSLCNYILKVLLDTIERSPIREEIAHIS